MKEIPSHENFEAAADAIVHGEMAALNNLLHGHPGLVWARSMREHRSTLLHYVSANGVEDFRQKTPGNIVQIAKILLDAGCDVNAESNAYGGGSTTLALVATSVHPERAGVQVSLMETLLDYGAEIDRNGGIINVCLANGRRMAAEFLAQGGACLDLEGAAGLGRLELAKSFVTESSGLEADATKVQMERGFLWACEYGFNSVVEFLLHQGIDLLTQANTGQTGLHWAIIGGQLETIKLLLNRGASVGAKNTHGGTALGQAVWCVKHGGSTVDYTPIISILLDAGANPQEAGYPTGIARLDEMFRGQMKS